MVREIPIYEAFTMDGETYETVLSPLNGPKQIQLVFPFQTKYWTRFKIIGLNGPLESVEAGPGARIPIGLSKIYSVDDFGPFITIEIFKKNPRTYIDTLKVKKRFVEGFSLHFLTQ
ncbi:hypothetical protein DICPUDRAFT_149166 [Dictyostelium purpureum]|uniref:Uncharacterized protein n=1 Tax=Dictyostelium purpureum TaxID=5786 RepID=F0ZD06_DICPU|nr:uncharacterized protein DICPUDRAFT_149166 [Dictyostelium purpureum]EGC38184.1 hypothetical protein DICPUDRAFT_149166 [Dictyostelium purpureum]|eukprot:XP_003285311.1 hypothetical protein DICPUDRAFT_149166 [Dictyostelium purpureum]